MKYEMAGITHVGNKRSGNQDCVICCSGKLNGKDAVLAAVADGMGGLSKGEVASRLIIENLESWWKTFSSKEASHSAKEISDNIDGVINYVHEQLAEMGRLEEIKIGTTLSLIILFENKGIIKQIGDSRIYEIRGENVIQLTTDQTYENLMISEGRMKKEEVDPRKNKALVNALGVSKKLYIDTLSGIINSDTLFLLASDGFYQGKESFPELFPWNSVGDLNKALEYMRDLILEDVAEDNLSGILVRVSCV